MSGAPLDTGAPCCRFSDSNAPPLSLVREAERGLRGQRAGSRRQPDLRHELGGTGREGDHPARHEPVVDDVAPAER